MFRRIRIQAGALLTASVLAGCGGGQYANTPYLGQDDQTQVLSSPPHEVVDTTSYWDGSAEGGSPSITINLSEQRAYFYQRGKLAGVALVATGKEGYDTPAGTFRIMEKIADKRSDLYGYIVEDGSGTVVNYDADIRKDPIPPGCHFEGAPMPYWMRITGGGIGMHQGPIPVPGSPASHGCIRMSRTVAAEFFAHARVGMPVRIVY
jgi:lipoprotein-anchoring transpeptidase ErfK/SrfK